MIAGYLRAHFQRIEESLAAEADMPKQPEKFEWGLDLLPCGELQGDPVAALCEYSRTQAGHSDAFFAHGPTHFTLADRATLIFPSCAETDVQENRTVHVRLFEPCSRHRAVVLLPHWNARGESYDTLCRILRLGGVAVARISLPYHDQRRPSDVPTASGMVSANLGRTIAAHRQAVLDVRCVIDWMYTGREAYRDWHAI